VATDAEEANRTGVKRPQEELVPALVQLTTQLGNFVNFEREHADKLYGLPTLACARVLSPDARLPSNPPSVAT
jgi:hypothetical protein